MTAVPGYYPDPWSPQQLRWWDGVAWTPHVSAPAAAPSPVAAPGVAPAATPGWPATVSGPTVPTVTPSYVVTGNRPRARAASDRPVWVMWVAALSAVVVLALAAFTWTHRRTAPDVAAVGVAQGDPRAGAATSAPAPGLTAGPSGAIDKANVDGSYSGPYQAPMTTPHGTELVTRADARAVMMAFWPQHETAVSDDDLAGIGALTTGAARLYEVGGRACGCWSQTEPRTLVTAVYYVRHQTRYPVDFLVEAQSKRSGAVSSWTDMYVFTKQGPGQPWLLALHSGYAPMTGGAPKLLGPFVDGQGYLAGSARPDAAELAAAGARLPAQTASLWQRTNDTGIIPAHDELVTEGINQTRLDRIAAHHDESPGQPHGSYRFWLSPNDPAFTYSVGDGSAIVCRAVRETVHYSTPAGYVIVQRAGFQPWGYPLAAGQYSRVTSTGAWQTCWGTTANPRQPSVLIDTEGDGGTTTAG